MWTPRSEPLSSGRGMRVAIDRDGSAVSYAEVLRCWRQDAAFRSLFLRLVTPELEATLKNLPDRPGVLQAAPASPNDLMSTLSAASEGVKTTEAVR